MKINKTVLILLTIGIFTCVTCRGWDIRTRNLTKDEVNVKIVPGDKVSSEGLRNCQKAGDDDELKSVNAIKIMAVEEFKSNTAQITFTDIKERPIKVGTISAPTYNVIFWKCPE